MKATLQKLVKEELKSMIFEKAKMSMAFRKTMEDLYDLELEQQELRKKFVAEKNPAKREAMKKNIITLHKKVKGAQIDFNKALATEPVDPSINEAILNEASKKDLVFVSKKGPKEAEILYKTLVNWLNDTGVPYYRNNRDQLSHLHATSDWFKAIGKMLISQLRRIDKELKKELRP